MDAVAATIRRHPLVTCLALAYALAWGLVALTFVSLGWPASLRFSELSLLTLTLFALVIGEALQPGPPTTHAAVEVGGTGGGSREHLVRESGT